MKYLLILLVSLFFSTCLAANGLDISNDVCNLLDQDDWTCLSDNHDFAIIEGIRGGHGITTNIVNCVAQAWKAGFIKVDLYVWMCPNCEGNTPPENLISQLVKQVGLSNFGTLWLDLEICDDDPTCWVNSTTNLNYVVSMFNAANATGAKVGIYSTAWEWEHLFGSSSSPTNFHNLPLWYANPDDVQSFSDFVPFAGWNTPTIKQYDWNGDDCNVSYDADWYPDSEVHL